MNMRIHLFMLLIMAVVALPAAGEIYQYEDDAGTVHFVEDPGKIPKKYQKKQKIRGESIDGPSGSVTRVFISGNRVLVPVTLSYRGKEVTAKFLLDTGATTCTISPSLAARLHFSPEEGRRGIARGVGGGVYEVRQATLDYLVVGPNRKYDVEASVIESTQADGLLGMNFLRELRYHIDFQTSSIKWGD
jgi:clan AA aspartic protease (TIGR02281 family)